VEEANDDDNSDTTAKKGIVKEETRIYEQKKRGWRGRFTYVLAGWQQIIILSNEIQRSCAYIKSHPWKFSNKSATR
jgi:hypothetical protein